MDADCCYYLLIAPHSCSSPFEDQSGRVPLCVPTPINPEWTSIKPTVHIVHLSLLTLFRPEMLLNRQSRLLRGPSCWLLEARQRERFQNNLSKLGKWFEMCGVEEQTQGLSGDVETATRPVVWILIQKLGKLFDSLLASLLLCELQTLQNTENEWEKGTGDMVKEQVGPLVIGWRQWHEHNATYSLVPTGGLYVCFLVW